MGPIAYLLLVATLASLVVVLLVCAGAFLSRGRLAGHVLTGIATMAVAAIMATALNHGWRMQRDRDNEVRAARARHLDRLHVVLRGEAGALNALAQGLREGRYFTQVANDARQAIWRDDTLSADVERHYPDYFHERERLIHDVLQYDTELGRLRQLVSASVRLSDAWAPSRFDFASALVAKCAGAAAVGRPEADVESRLAPGEGGHVEPREAGVSRAFEQYRCPPNLTRVARDLYDRAADLADAAVAASGAARRYAEETELRGSCTYTPGE